MHLQGRVAFDAVAKGILLTVHFLMKTFLKRTV